jgi:thioredoxin 2
MVEPVVEQLATDLAGRLKVAKINTDEQPGLGNRFGVRGIPTLILFENGREKDRITGAMPAPAMRSWLELRLPE